MPSLKITPFSAIAEAIVAPSIRLATMEATALVPVSASADQPSQRDPEKINLSSRFWESA
jgi:hypothetical protein